MIFARSSCLVRRSGLLAAALIGLAAARAGAESPWDSLLTDSQWYVPSANLLAYLVPGSDLSDVQAAADQTVWELSTSVNGVFSGTSTATIRAGLLEINSTTSMNGLVTESGQVRIVFTAPDTPATIGIGQVRDVEGIPFIEMQMMTGANGLYVTHWAYMASYDGSPLPPPEISPGQLTSPEWSWMEGTQWSFQNDELFGEDGTGFFSVEDYVNGYYWGTGTGPAGSAAESFTLIGSATPEGNILFNLLAGETLTSLTGMISGGGLDGVMVLRSYNSEGTFGNPGYAQVVPEPGTCALAALGAAVFLFRRHRWKPTCPSERADGGGARILPCATASFGASRRAIRGGC
jgi:hypothetical protein